MHYTQITTVSIRSRGEQQVLVGNSGGETPKYHLYNTVPTAYWFSGRGILFFFFSWCDPGDLFDPSVRYMLSTLCIGYLPSPLFTASAPYFVNTVCHTRVMMVRDGCFEMRRFRLAARVREGVVGSWILWSVVSGIHLHPSQRGVYGCLSGVHKGVEARARAVCFFWMLGSRREKGTTVYAAGGIRNGASKRAYSSCVVPHNNVLESRFRSMLRTP